VWRTTARKYSKKVSTTTHRYPHYGPVFAPLVIRAAVLGVDMWVLFVCRGDRRRRYWPPRSPWRRAGARTETSTRAGRELQKLSPRCLPCALYGWKAGWQREQPESFSPAAASQSPRRAQNLAGTRAAYVTIFLRPHLYLRHVPFVFSPRCIISEMGRA
jgi:hypothetical protein